LQPKSNDLLHIIPKKSKVVNNFLCDLTDKQEQRKEKHELLLSAEIIAFVEGIMLDRLTHFNERE